MKFFYNSFFVSKNSAEASSPELQTLIDRLNIVAKENSYESPEASINLPFDENNLKAVIDLKNKKVSSNLKYVINIGIGGSNLGAKAIYDAIFGNFDVLEPQRLPKMLFADTNDPESLCKIVSLLNDGVQNPEEVLIVMISKSGTTTETVANFEIINEALQKKFPNIAERYVAITDEGSKLWNKVKEKGIATLSIPKIVGGRYSVFSSVGLFPIACIGLNVQELISGARDMRDQCLSKNIEENPAILSAFLLASHVKEGFKINDNFIFHPELESIGKWYRQLMGESIGKEKDLDDNVVNQGITPTVSIGSTDLHSMGQLYLGGPKDKITTFISTNVSSGINIPQNLLLNGLVGDINGKSVEFIMGAIMKGVKTAYEKKKLPYMEVVLNSISEKSIAKFFQFKMMEMMYLGKLLNVNSFDQPNVEDYKVETKKILSGLI